MCDAINENRIDAQRDCDISGTQRFVGCWSIRPLRPYALTKNCRLQFEGPTVKLSQGVAAYIERKRAGGFIYRTSGKVLWRFSRYVGKIDISRVTDQNIQSFLVRNAISNNTWRRYRSHLNRFFTYWFARRQVKRIPQIAQKLFPWREGCLGCLAPAFQDDLSSRKAVSSSGTFI